MSIDWTFPSNNYGTLNGIGEAGIETFNGSPYKSLAREICQNSLDAKISKDKPVVVEFSCSEINTDKFSGFSVLKEAIESCLSFWTKQKNEKTMDFFKRALSVCEKKEIPVLRISDFNTTGLLGSDQEYNTPWQNLVKASGVSDKDESSGGSFGIGKSAPFATSDLRTVFYATHDRNNLKAFQGIARLVSFQQKSAILKRDTDKITTGIGYYGETNKNQAIRECRSLDPDFSRTEPGTDVFILGFSNKSNWQKEVIGSVLDDFLVSIYLGLLEVRVEGIMISQSTLPKMIEEYKETVPMAYNYYQTLISPDAHIIEENFGELGKIELHILIQNGLHRRVLMSRMSGMKIFDQKSISQAIHFAGVCILKSETVNAYFRQMENPQHDAWQPERYKKNPQEAKKRKQELFHYIKNKVLELGRTTTVAEVDAEGVGEFLPDDVIPKNGTDKHESVVDTTKNIDINLSDLKSVQKGFEATAQQVIPEWENSEGLPEEEEFGENGSKDSGNDTHNQSKNGTGFGNNSGENAGTNGTGSNPYETGIDGEPHSPIKKAYALQTMALRLILLNADKKRYRLIFIPEKTSGEGYLQFKLSGEQSNVNVSVSNATNPSDGSPLKTSNNTIYLNHITAKQKMSVEFTVDFSERSSMEVNLYGYKI